jgi:RNA recognition motif-containing protein
MKIFIANIPNKLEEAELKQLLTQYGHVASIKLITEKETGKRKGFGFIEMPVDDQARKAIAGLNGKEIHGRKISLKEDELKDKAPAFAKPAYDDRRPRVNKDGYSGKDKEVDGNRW